MTFIIRKINNLINGTKRQFVFYMILPHPLRICVERSGVRQKLLCITTMTTLRSFTGASLSLASSEHVVSLRHDSHPSMKSASKTFTRWAVHVNILPLSWTLDGVKVLNLYTFILLYLSLRLIYIHITLMIRCQSSRQKKLVTLWMGRELAECQLRWQWETATSPPSHTKRWVDGRYRCHALSASSPLSFKSRTHYA